jgi:hypothetical protein
MRFLYDGFFSHLQISFFVRKNFGKNFSNFFNVIYLSPFPNFPLFLGGVEHFCLKKNSGKTKIKADVF